MSLRVIAISAPEYPFGRLGTTSLTSRDPVSLYNASRYAAFLADNQLGAWGDSNWAVPRKIRRKNLLLMNSLSEETSYFEELLARERPNLLLIGAMTMCFPGAIACAKLARQMFGESIYIVLGGRHASETIYTDKARTCVKHHNGSPLKLISEGKIDNVFDLIVSGEGEFVIAKVGEVIADLAGRNDSWITPALMLENISNIPGNWIAGCVTDGHMKTIISKGITFDRDRLPSPAKMFGIGTGFDVFQGALTGHAFSDMGTGCIYDCGFCSERTSVCGPLSQVKTSSNRLFRQLMDIHDVIKEDTPGRRTSAFIEDSIILGGLTSQLTKLNSILEDHSIDIKFGGQLTVDTAIKQKLIITELVPKGLEYIFVGLETFDPSSIGGMSKDVGKYEWIMRAEQMISEYSEIGIKVGVSILFGLGESQQQRLAILEQVSSWKQRYGNPVVRSFNWAVQHPLKGKDNGVGYDYLNWAVEKVEYVDVLRDYGEASLIYHIPNVTLPTVEELLEIRAIMKADEVTD
ncbi:MAG: B12-binding domain/radical SAM domain-containing protein [Patescibacteria group bacterium]